MVHYFKLDDDELDLKNVNLVKVMLWINFILIILFMIMLVKAWFFNEGVFYVNKVIKFKSSLKQYYLIFHWVTIIMEIITCILYMLLIHSFNKRIKNDFVLSHIIFLTSVIESIVLFLIYLNQLAIYSYLFN
jgi:hypothetical protein